MKTDATTEIYIRSFEQMKPEYKDIAINYFVYLMAIWIIGWVLVGLVSFVSKQDVFKCFKWYFKTKLNVLALWTLFFAGMYLCGR